MPMTAHIDVRPMTGLVAHSPPNRKPANIALKIETLIFTHMASPVRIVSAPKKMVTADAMIGNTGKRPSTMRMTTMATAVAINSAQVPALMPPIALTMNIATSGPNSDRMLTVCSGVNGYQPFLAGSAAGAKLSCAIC